MFPVTRTAPQPEPEEKEKRGKIFNSMPTPKEVAKTEIKVEAKPAPVVIDDKKLPQIDEHDDDWGAVPAFLRRSKIK